MILSGDIKFWVRIMVLAVPLIALIAVTVIRHLIRKRARLANGSKVIEIYGEKYEISDSMLVPIGAKAESFELVKIGEMNYYQISEYYCPLNFLDTSVTS